MVDRLRGTGGHGFDPSLRVWWLCFAEVRGLQVNLILSGLCQLQFKVCMAGTFPPGSRCPVP